MTSTCVDDLNLANAMLLVSIFSECGRRRLTGALRAKRRNLLCYLERGKRPEKADHLDGNSDDQECCPALTASTYSIKGSMADLAEAAVRLVGIPYVLNVIGFNLSMERENIMAAGLAEFPDFCFIEENDIRDTSKEFGK
jgi:hypothetical protein